MKIAGYEIREKIHQGKHFTVYKAVDKAAANANRILKVLDKAIQYKANIDAADNEYSLVGQVESRHVIKALNRVEDQNGTAIVFEDIEGLPLNHFIKENGPFPIDRFLELAIFITDGLKAIHKQNIIHRDINSANIIWNPNERKLKIIDFDIAVKYEVKVTHPGNPEKLRGTLAYLSPEQTGRTNRRVDHRSDLYSLGVTFYEMLTGQLPFPHQGPLEIVHAHLARAPTPPHLVNEHIPGILSGIILKLLAKNPEERYQSSAGLNYDLEKFRESKSSGTKEPGPFKLGAKDFSGKLQIPEKIYGREKEIEQLLDTYEQVSRGACRMLMVTGYSGTGKTALVNEIHKPITKDRGNFISCKFEQFQKNVPYFAFIQAISRFCDLLLTENQAALAAWKQIIDAAVNPLGKVLTDIIPNLEQIIGKQPGVPESEGVEAKNRFNDVFLRFIRAISTPGHPLVFFIDDLQWADHPSLELMKLLVSDAQNRFFLLIGAYRDNEVSPSHPLITTVEELKKKEVSIPSIKVKNLKKNDIRDWLKDTFNSVTPPDQQDIENLSNRIYGKTGGNAFFMTQFLTNLYKENLLSFDFNRSRWQWDIEKIDRLDITKNVVDLLVRRLRTLPPGTQEALKLAACVGNIFALETISVISGKSTGLKEFLEIALRENFISPIDDKNFKFNHDRIQQAAYSLISDNDKKTVHLEIGRLLLEEYHMFNDAGDFNVNEKTEQHIFDIVNHFNIAESLIEDDEEKIKIAHLNLKAAQKAKIVTAYQPGWDFVSQSVLLLSADCWKILYDLTLSIYNEAIKLAYLSGNFTEVNRLGEITLNFTTKVIHRSTAYEYKIMALTAQNKYDEVVDLILELYGGLGIDIPRKPGDEEIASLFEETKTLLNQIGEKNLTKLPAMKDEEKRLAFQLYLRVSFTIAVAAQELYPLFVNKMLLLSLEHGVTPETPLLLTEFGILNILEGRTEDGYNLGIAAMELMDKVIGHETMKMRSLTLIHFYLSHWKMPYKDVSAQLWEIHQKALYVGDSEYASYVLCIYLLMQRNIGTEISLASRKGEMIKRIIKPLNQPNAIVFVDIFHQPFLNLEGEIPNQVRTGIDIESMLPEEAGDMKSTLHYYENVSQLFLGFLFEDYFILDCTGELAKAPLEKGAVDYPDYLLFSSLMRLQLYETASVKERRKYLKEIRESVKTMEKWAGFGPLNFQHRCYLMQAELYRVTNKGQKAAEFYDKAIESARKYEFLYVEAISNELAAKYYMKNDRDPLAEFYFQKAWQCYRKWGALAKIKHLEKNYPKYMNSPVYSSFTAKGTITTSTIESSSSSLDVKSILKASRSLSGEVYLKSLLKKMMHILIENAGAQKGVLIENRNGNLFIQAEINIDGIPEILHDIPVAGQEKVPLSMINYVARSKEKLVLDNASKDDKYSSDNYIKKHQPRSVICCPILKKSRLSGIIYLENNHVDGAFTPARVEVIDMLSAQIAISIENARLVENLEDKIKERTIALQNANDELVESNQKINDSVNYASRIQDAVLPGQDLLTELLPQHFVLYKPCSMVSGDFYWIKQIGHRIIAAAADCTGHGVPGALLSMLGIAFLNEVSPQLALLSMLNAGNILDQLRIKFITALRQKKKLKTHTEGMDIALCIIDPVNKQLQFAGANNPLFLIRNNELTEVKGDRMPISFHRKEQSFTTHDIPFQSDDMIYLFSDGYADQLSEKDERKFMKKNFQQLLIEINQEPLSKQKEILNKQFEEWKGNFTQVDDVLVFGIRL